MNFISRYVLCVGFVLAISAFVTTSGLAQGHGHGGGGGNGRGASGGMGGPPSGVGVDRGLGNASERSSGRSDSGLGTASDRSNGRSNSGLERARISSQNLKRADDDLRDHPGIAKTLHTNANSLRAGYQTALAANPQLTFGNYVAATRLGQNLHSRFPNITRDSILAGLASGRSIGRTLQDLGLSDRQAKEAKKAVEQEIKDAKKMD
ncbi:MAG: hypothetical protein C5B55_12090 [Blastocatellia bacterium]|nr:MAG: hypothetical protein C5B55_12090 [Blastocatellia bacterium]